MDHQPAADFPPDFPPMAASIDAGPAWQECGRATDRSQWNPLIARFFEYWLSMAPAGRLPGRQHFDPLDIVELMPRVWILDVVRTPAGARFRYRLVGTKEVETLQREVTGRWLDEVHPHLNETPSGFARFNAIAAEGKATYRKGPVTFVHHKDDRIVENCMLPMARDGALVDMIAVCSVLYRSAANGIAGPWSGQEKAPPKRG
jgi:PAS domain